MRPTVGTTPTLHRLIALLARGVRWIARPLGRIVFLVNTVTIRALTLTIRAYQFALRPLLPGHCRFEPSCSEYALDAIRRNGPWRGSVQAVRRILRCHPWGGFGYDPVP
ncbi:MAG: hypothetical protein HBSAPP02_08700 [Phycisphaerae bacterium]|nr:MAG: membrane protein insertion efficiency factor YidD [Planctomycetia bacterium]RIK71555.1 MAG: membrane protein insertion efficiency factor YidD [Planctomycetota bacterium]GJQ25838.1 MAG: hypothetical protein HBSAPP02_08700 [Phycisphaerae bacterium]